MPELEYCRWCIRHCTPKAGKFWNNFCKSPSPLSYVILLLVFLNLLHWVYFSAFANNYGALSYFQDLGYTFTCCSGLLLFLSGMFAIHALNVLWPSRTKIVFIQMALVITSALIIVSLSTYFYAPTKEQMHIHVYEYFALYGRNPGIMEDIEIELNCCGINGYRDYVEGSDDISIDGVKLPNSCCKTMKNGCDSHDHGGVLVNSEEMLIKYIKLDGCVPRGGDYWALKRSAKQSFVGWTAYFVSTFFHFLSCIAILLIFNYYICCKFPSERNIRKAVHRKIEQVYKERDEIIEEATSNLEVAEYTVEGPAILEWYNMHYLPKWGSYGNIDRIARDGFTLPKRYEFPLFPFDAYKQHPETFTSGTNLDLYEGTDVYKSPPPEPKDEETPNGQNPKEEYPKSIKSESRFSW